LRTLCESVKLKVLLESNEGRGQRFFVFGHSETPWSAANERQCFELNIGKSVGNGRNSHCFPNYKHKEMMQQNIGEANAVQSITELPRQRLT